MLAISTNLARQTRLLAVAVAGVTTMSLAAFDVTPAQAAAPKYPSTVSSTGWIQPMDPAKASITDSYGSRGHHHFGTDYATRPARKVPIRAAHYGTVKRVAGISRSGGYGNMIDIYHGKGVGTRYAHMSSVNVRAGQKVKAGQIIGYQGSTGQSSGPHLHFEVHQVHWLSGWWGHNSTINPQTFMKKKGAPLY